MWDTVLGTDRQAVGCDKKYCMQVALRFSLVKPPKN
jgi:protein gp37